VIAFKSDAREGLKNEIFWEAEKWNADDIAGIPNSVDIAIVGAGLTGLSCAYHWLKAHPDMSVVVFDSGELGTGASGRTTGMVTPGVGQDFAGLVSKLGTECAAATYQLTREAVRYVGEIVANEKIECEYEKVGQLVLAQGASGESRLRRQSNAFAATGQPYQILDRDALRKRIMLPSGKYHHEDLAALLLPEVAMFNPAKFLRGLALAVQALGGKIVCQSRVHDLIGGAQPAIVLANGCTIKAKKIILATASESTNLSNLTGRIIPVSLKVAVTKRLSISQLQLLGWAQRDCIIDSRKLFNYFRLTADNRIIFGGGAPLFGRPTEEQLNFSDLHREMADVFTHLDDLQIACQWSGTIDYTLDGLPIMGCVAGEPNLLYVGGFCGHGIALSVSAGKWLQQMAASPAEARPLPWFRNKAPLIPGEWVRRICFNLASKWMMVRNV
jgi:gamma-glutamylputrescine oxidase